MFTASFLELSTVPRGAWSVLVKVNDSKWIVLNCFPPISAFEELRICVKSCTNNGLKYKKKFHAR